MTQLFFDVGGKACYVNTLVTLSNRLEKENIYAKSEPKFNI